MLKLFSGLDIIIMSISAILVIIWLFLYFYGLKYQNMFEQLEEKEFPLTRIYIVGYSIVFLLKLKFNGKKDIKLRKSLALLYGDMYRDYYIRVIYSQRLAIAYTCIVLGFIMYGIADTIAVTIGLVLGGFLAYYYYGNETYNKINKRSEEVLRDFPEVISKLALLTNAGMILREAWSDVAKTNDSCIYKEMQLAVDEMNNGMPEGEAIYRFGMRCIIPEIKKFSSTIVQGIVKGNRELANMLQEQSKEVWGMKKQYIRREGEKAASKLLIPIVIMFLGILIMIIVPIFTNLGT